ncbi:ZIP family metal transporter [Catenuloplanes japonicus]|uniref:ZIP family metal transporter n=1 Tax=Catenuloplanes japonicus TaxID=33876 RepID=UPI00052768F5|nr:ZIP family zinc transporter [Catenuloplanes japonicus]
MLEAAFWGFVGGFALLLGAGLGLVRPVPERVVGVVMAFGAGVLISTIAFDLVEEAFQEAGALPAGAGIVAGALTFFAGDAILDRRGGDKRKHPTAAAGGAALALVLGAMLDGIPESAAIGVSLLGGGSVSVAVVAGVFLSNVPESLSAAVGLRASGRSARWIMGLWLGVAVISAVSAALGYAVLGQAGASTIAVVQAFAAGAILTMLADTMMPVAFKDTGPLSGIVTCAGFLLAFMLSHV